uniref:Uncharacterized protein n=1 Tax=Streptomyces sp. NBC_00003 TaxID=2903608 RepID=A0AAU2V3W5_9ACTN
MIHLDWPQGDLVVRWTHAGRTVEQAYDRPPQSAMVWGDRVLVVEALDCTPNTATDNAVVFAADGSEVARLKPPRGLVAEPSWVFGFYQAYPDAHGQPIVVVSTQVGDFWGRPDVVEGSLVDMREWR